VLDRVRPAEGERVLGPFAGARLGPESEAWGWWRQRLVGRGGDVTMAVLANLEGYEELVAQLLARVPRSKLPGVVAKLPATTLAAGLTAEKLAALPAEKVMDGRSVRERLAGLSPDELASDAGCPACAKQNCCEPLKACNDPDDCMSYFFCREGCRQYIDSPTSAWDICMKGCYGFTRLESAEAVSGVLGCLSQACDDAC
jgi:hypothetical protein